MSKQYLDDPPPERLIFDAVASGDAAAIESLLTDDPRLIGARGGWQLYRPLFFAVQTGQDATIDVLKRHGATLDIFQAAALGDIAALRTLLSAAPELANVRREHYDATPLHAARANVQAARLLLEFGADVSAVDGPQQRLTALHCRAEHGDVEMIELLLAHGADVHAGSCMGSPLHCAVGGFQHAPPERWREVAERLFVAGADVNAGSSESGDPNWTPLHHAAWRNHAPAVSWLIEHGADKRRVNKYGSTPLQTARYFGHLEIVKILSPG